MEPARHTVSKTLELGDVRLAAPWVQAALSGYSDLPMRRVARAYGAPYALNEVVIDEKVLERGKGRRRILHVPDDDHPVAGQLMGSRPDSFALAAVDLIDGGYDVVDVNFGCPVGKVLGRCRGGYLLGDPSTALEILERVVDACRGRVPVTLKMRRGTDESARSEANFFSILDGAYDRGIAAVTVHGRSVKQRYDGPSSWDFLARVKAHVGTRTLLGSGDLFTAHDVFAMLEKTGVDGVTIARGAIGNPFIFDECNRLAAGESIDPPSIGEQRAAIELHYAQAREFYPGNRSIQKTRRHAIQYAALHTDPVECRDAWVGFKAPEDFAAILDRMYGE